MRLTHRQMIEVVHLSPVDSGRSFEEDNMRILSLLGATVIPRCHNLYDTSRTP